MTVDEALGSNRAGRLGATKTLSERWIRPTRRLSALVGVILLLVLGFTKESPVSDRIASLALFALVMASVVACVEVVVTRQVFRKSHPSDRTVPTRAWITTIVLFSAGSALAAQTWFRAGTTIAGIDIGPPDGVAWLGRLFAPWSWSGSDLGSPASLELQLPWAALVGLIHSAGGSAELAQRIWYATLFTAAALGALLLLKVLGSRPLPAAVGAAVYVLNPYVVTSVGTSPVYLSALALAVLLPTCVLGAARSEISVRAAAILISVSAPLIGYVYLNPPLVGMLLAIVMASPLLAWWLWGAETARRALLTTILGAGLLVMTSAYWIVPAAIQLHSSVVGNLATTSSWTWTEVRATISNAFWLNTTWAWTYEYFPFAGDYSSPPLSILKFVLPATAFGALCIADRRSGGGPDDSARIGLPVAVAASMVGLFVLVFSTGTRSPGNWIFNPLYQLPYGWLLREPGRFLMVVGLAYAILVAAFAERLCGIRLAAGWIGGSLRVPLGPAAAIVLGGAISIGPGFPLVVGAVVPDARPPLPSMHVRLPGYWMDMAAFVDRAPYDGAVLVFPPDDFYQMPYLWGYYGTDSFIPNLMNRAVLVPSPQGYFQTSGALIGAIDLTAASLLRDDWAEADRLLQSLGTPMILVRGDIDSNFPGRSILAPAPLSAALGRAPNFKVLHRSGPLTLFTSLSYTGSVRAIAHAFATVDSNSPYLRVLSILSLETQLVSGPALAGIPRISQAPPLSTWDLSAGELRTVFAEPIGWHYRVGLLNSDRPPRVVDPHSDPQALSPFVATETSDPSNVQRALMVQLPLGESLITNGAFQQGAWQGAVGDCNAVSGAPARGLSVKVVDDGPKGLPALRLSASADSACESFTIPGPGGAVLVHLWLRHISGGAPRVCVWEVGPDRCAPSPRPATRSGWAEYTMSVVPDAGTTGLALFIYADADPSAARTVNDYAGVEVYSVPSTDLVLVGYPDGPDNGDTSQLLVLHESYSDNWKGPVRARHVLVDGMMNGWITGPTDRAFSPSYPLADLVSAGLWLSGASLAFVVLLALSLLPVRDMGIRLRRRLHG